MDVAVFVADNAGDRETNVLRQQHRLDLALSRELIHSIVVLHIDAAVACN